MGKILRIYNKFFSFISQNIFFIKESILYFFYKKNLNTLLKKKNPLVSIIVPTFNRALMLKKRSIKSILKQTYQNFEIIVIVDGSTDNTLEILKNFNDSRIKIFNIKRNKKRYPQSAFNHWLCGPVEAINYGLKKITGDWIARLDDDEIWGKKHLEISLKKLIETKSEFVSGNRLSKKFIGTEGLYYITDHSKPTIYDIKYDVRIGGNNTWVYASYLSFFKANMNCWRKDKNKVNDTDLVARMMKVGVKRCFTNKATHAGLPKEKNANVGLKYYLDNEQNILNEYNI